MEKRYKIKEEVKKYCVASYRDREMTHDEWSKKGFNKEALEEVEDKIEVGHKVNKFHLEKCNGAAWTEKERELIEFVLNKFEDLTGLDLAANSFALMCNKKEEFPLFTGWLKQIKH